MSDYGVTPQGVVIKRFDTILGELHDDLSAGWRINTRLNPKSFLNVELTSYADKLAELWEFGEQVYHSMYPFSAEDTSLDNAVQYGGISREEARPTFYPIHCECLDGTTIPARTMIRSNTNPSIQFLTSRPNTVDRSAFNRAVVRIAAIQNSDIYTIVLNGAIYSYTSSAATTEQEILSGLESVIIDSDFYISINENLLYIASVNVQKVSNLILSGNLTTETVTGLVTFASEMNGEVVLPSGTITQIVTAVPGLLSVSNLASYILGRLRQTDSKLRESYADKIFARSTRMVESIKSAILLNVQGVTAVAGYQNDTNIVDAYGRWPHCVEIVADGGDEYQIALQIWDKKAGGINTFGNVEVEIPGDEGEPVIVRFNRPEHVYVWFDVEITLNHVDPLPPNYIEAIQNVIIMAMGGVIPGTPIIPQKLIDANIYAKIPGIGFIETTTFYSVDSNEQPGQFNPGMVPITVRQRAVTDETRIEVGIAG